MGPCSGCEEWGGGRGGLGVVGGARSPLLLYSYSMPHATATATASFYIFIFLNIVLPDYSAAQRSTADGGTRRAVGRDGAHHYAIIIILFLYYIYLTIIQNYSLFTSYILHRIYHIDTYSLHMITFTK